MLLPGTTYGSPGEWQNITLANLDTHLAEHTRLLRAQVDTSVDSRQAYVDHIIVNAYSAPGYVSLRIKDPHLEGVAPYEPTLSRSVRATQYSEETTGNRNSVVPASAIQIPKKLARKKVGVAEAQLHMDGNALFLHRRPFFPRAIQTNGEDWAFLKELGFNTIQIDSTPTPIDTQLAEKLNLWLIAPPPSNWTGDDLSITFRRVIAWRLDKSPRLERPIENSTDSVADWIANIRALDQAIPRPIACAEHVMDDLGKSDVFILSQTAKEKPDDFPRRIRQACIPNRSSTMKWVSLSTQPRPEIQQQLDAFRFANPNHLLSSEFSIHSTAVDLHQRYLAVATSGVRGVICDSETRLDRKSSNAQARCNALRLANHQIQTIAPWLGAGHLQDSVQISNHAFTSTTWKSDRGWLLALQPNQPLEETQKITITIPGPSESATVLASVRGGLERLHGKRVAGGFQFGLQALGPRYIFVTSDPRVAKAIGKKFKNPSKAEAIWKSKMVASCYQRALVIREQLPVSFDGAMNLDQRIDKIERHMTDCETYHSVGNTIGIEANATAALLQLQRLQQDLLAACRRLSPIMTPFVDEFGSLDFHQQLQDIATHNKGDNLLPEANMEDLQQLQWQGWNNFIRQTSDLDATIHGTVAITNNDSYQGNASLRLEATSAQIGRHSAGERKDADPILWVESRRIPVPPNRLLVLSGAVRIHKLSASSHAGEAFISDSIGGSSLATRIGTNGEWQTVHHPARNRYATIRFDHAWTDGDGTSRF